MKWYLILAHDAADSLPGRQQARPAHLARLEALQAEQRLLAAGPLPVSDTDAPGIAGFSGSAIIAAFASIEDARAWAAVDPYVAAGVYQHVEIKPFMKVFPQS
ncbi:YciI family protein [Frateuria aurantia]